jgi:hypothetical protein
MTNYEPTRGGDLDHTGRFSAPVPTAPDQSTELAWRDDHDDSLFIDQRETVAAEGYAFLDSSTTPRPGKVFTNADGVIIGETANGTHVATVEFVGVDLVERVADAKGMSEDEVDEWFAENDGALADFLELKDIESNSDDLRAARLTVTVGLDDVVTFGQAMLKLQDKEAATYLRDGLFSKDASFTSDLIGFIDRYENGDNCSECGEDSSGGEGYDGRCGNCADIAEEAGEWD